MIDGMVNWAMFVKISRVTPTNLLFETSVHSKLFIVLLADFLSDIRAFKGEGLPLGLNPAPANTKPSNLTFLFHLREVCANPMLGHDVSALQNVVEAFAAWLEVEFVAPDVNFANINVVSAIKVARYRYLKMCGDIAKHNIARLSTNINHLRKLLERAGKPISEQDAYLAIEDFAEWFHNIFIYHSSVIAEFLNNIRWAIFDYLAPEFKRSWHLSEGATEVFPLYGYRIPKEISEPLARAMYWDVMNRVRTTPYMYRFVISDSFKDQY